MMNGALQTIGSCVVIGAMCSAFALAAEDIDATVPTLRLDRDVLAELKVQAVSGWELLAQKLDSVDVKYRQLQSERQDGEPIGTPRGGARYRIAWDRGRRLALRRSEYDEYPDAVYHDVRNSNYVFEVWDTSKQNRGELRRATFQSEQVKGEFWQTDSIGNRINCARAACMFISLPLAALVESDEFEPIEAIEEQSAGRRRIRFSTRYLGEQGDSRRKDGIYTIVVDPANHYRLLEGGISFPRRQDLETIEVTYRADPKVIVPKMVRYARELPTEGYTLEDITEFDLPQEFNLPQEEFYLDYYGFDESVLEPLSPRRWLRWLLIACGAASLLLAYWVVSRRKRRT